MGGLLALETNQGVTNWIVSPGGATLEELCGGALCRLFGLGPEADATFMASGTYANQQALYLALHAAAEKLGFDFAQTGFRALTGVKPLAAAASVDAHFSIRHAARMLGLGEEGLIALPVDGRRRIDADRMARLLDEAARERTVFCVVATAGTTATGAVDPLDRIADYCGGRGIWLHADAAYGLAYKLVPDRAPLFRGIERADSVTWDPHKQMGVPIPNSVLFCRRGGEFARMSVHSGYFNRREDAEPNPGLKSPPTTRPFSALPLVASLLHQGLDAAAARLAAPLAAIARFYDHCRAQADVETVHAPDTGILCFRVVPPGVPGERLDDLQNFVHREICAGGRRSISVTRLDGRTVLRVVAVSPAVTFEALLETLAEIRAVAERWGRPERGGGS
jgi:L-2,4-diaminobutyrate decarboxylase